MKNCFLLLALAVCTVGSSQNRPLSGNGRVVPLAVPTISAFSELEIYGLVGKIEVIVGNAPGLRILADDNLAARIEVQQTGQRLVIAMPQNRDTRLWLEDTNIRVEVQTPVLQMLDVEYNGTCVVRGLQNERLVVRKGQNGNLYLFGAVQNLQLDKTGNGDVRADSLVAERATVVSSGNGEVRLFVRGLLEVTQSGNGSVLNAAQPTVREAAARPAQPSIDIVLVNKRAQRRSLTVRGPETARFSYGFDLGPLGQRSEKWPVGTRVLNHSGRVLYEVRPEDAGRKIVL